MVPRTVLSRSGPISVNTVRPVNTVQPRTIVNNAGPMKNVNTVKGTRVNIARPKAVLSAVKGNKGNAVKASACWVWRPKHKILDHVSRNNGASMSFKRFDLIDAKESKSYLTDYEEIPGGFVAFGGNSKGGKITGKGKIRTGKLDFEDVYFVKELKFNLFSVSQMCDKKNSVLFTDTECVVLSPDFKLTDESHVLLKVPRKDNMYSVDLKNVVPQGGLTCLFAKATPDESNLWHRRLGHVNFKTMNKLVRGNLVRGLPSKLFEINQTCVACQKGKQHRASCKTKTVSSISQPLQMLHMDLFGPTFVKSLMKKMYCLVVTDDFSRFSWVFFLATKDETSEILKTFITGIENLIDLRVKVIRCDNGTEFKNRVMNQFCEMKGIKREFSVARTPQQNGVAERKNMTLIEAARTMLADSKLPTTF
ncbi:putative ribonuclease H-like domain-containing protein [Tanacetum coccineum]